MKKMDPRIFFLFFIIVISWALGWPANKVGLMYSSPVWYTALRLLVGTITMMLICAGLRKLALPSKEEWPLILIVGLLQIGIYILLANIGLEYLPAGRSSLLAYTTPLWIMPAAVMFFGEESTPLKWLGFLLGISGLIILLSPWELDWSNRHILLGTAMLLLAAFGWSISILCIRYMKWNRSPLELMPWQLLVGTIPIVILALVKEPAMEITYNVPLLLSLVYTGVLVTGFSYWGGIVVNRELPTIVVSIGFLMVPVLSLLTSSLFMHEVITLPTGFAMTLIFLGLCCVVL